MPQEEGEEAVDAGRNPEEDLDNNPAAADTAAAEAAVAGNTAVDPIAAAGPIAVADRIGVDHPGWVGSSP